ncbi:lectin-like domain-containing protein, partial [Oenococcus oeni]|uniref:lectin-like domain-containing protein n=1 Tax=Oenococcus oeni TaxID=1247 RepID=UPI001647DB49
MKKNKARYLNIDDTTRFKLYKSGKQWIVSGLTRLTSKIIRSFPNIKLIRNKHADLEDEASATHKTETALKGLSALAAFFGGSSLIASTHVSADQVQQNAQSATEKAASEQTLATANQVTLSAGSQTSSNGSQSLSTSDSISSSESTSASESTSTSESESISTSEFISTSELSSTSGSEPTSISESTINSDTVANSESVSSQATQAHESQLASSNVSTSESTVNPSSVSNSDSISTSEPTSTSQSMTSSSESNAQKNVQISYKDVVSAFSTSATNDEYVQVTAANFLDYFQLNGTAKYDASTGTVTLTTPQGNEVGNFSLKSKIDMNQSFTLTGQVNLGSKTQSQGGADGIGFAFFDGNTTDLGVVGGNLGIGGLPNAVGFKLDTYHNVAKSPSTSGDASNQYGWEADPTNAIGNSSQYGAFVNTSNETINGFQRWWATVTGTPQALNANDLNGQFHDFSINYDGPSKTLTIKYTQTDGTILTWTETVQSSSEAMALAITASTGGSNNLQQFKITSFDYYEAATVNVEYIDQQGNLINTSNFGDQASASYPNGSYSGETYTTNQLSIPGYTFIGMGDGSIATDGTLSEWGNNGTVIYVYSNNASTSSSESTSASASTSESISTSESTSASAS